MNQAKKLLWVGDSGASGNYQDKWAFSWTETGNIKLELVNKSDRPALNILLQGASLLAMIQWWRRYLIVWLWMQISLPIIYQMTNPIPPMESPGNSASDGGLTCPNWLDISKVIEKRRMSFFFHSSWSKIDICCYGGPTPFSQQHDEESGEASS